ncbi:MAG: PIG-L deacetylase family protein [Dehalococcoidales bacterium]
MTEQADVIVITPHPDDAESRMAGTVARWTREGKAVVYVVCTNGDKGTSDPEMPPQELARLREREQLAAAEVLGVSDVVFLRYPDQSLEDSPEFRKELVRAIRKYRPETVVTVAPYRGRLDHRDHRMTAQVTLDAVGAYSTSAHVYPDLLEEGLLPHRVSEVWFCGTGDPNHYVDITDTIDAKIAALRCHRSQVGDRPEIADWMRRNARTSAEGLDFEMAEGFHREEIPDRSARLV